jgi:hypothetical protein
VDKLINVAFPGIFLGVKKIGTPLEITIENASMNFPKTKKNNITNFQNQRYTGIFMSLCNHMPRIYSFYRFKTFFVFHIIFAMFGKLSMQKMNKKF